MSIRRFLTVATCLLALAVAAAGRPRALQYYPDGRDIVCVNGDNRYTRALYGGYTDFRVETSDRPIFATFSGKNHRNVRFRLTTKGKTVALEQTVRCEARYYAGRRSYRLTDPAFGKGSVDQGWRYGNARYEQMMNMWFNNYYGSEFQKYDDLAVTMGLRG